MEIKSFWPDRLKEIAKEYQVGGTAHWEKRTQMEHLNDMHDLDQLKEEDIPLMMQVWDGMNEIYEGPIGPGSSFSKLTKSVFVKKYPIFENSWEYFALRKPLKVGERDPLPHISTLICNLEPFQSFRLKYPALYETMIVWVWG